jgi:hypothetical protein
MNMGNATTQPTRGKDKLLNPSQPASTQSRPPTIPHDIASRAQIPVARHLELAERRNADLVHHQTSMPSRVRARLSQRNAVVGVAARDDARAVRAGDRELGGLDETVVGGGGAGLDGGGGSGCSEVPKMACPILSPTSNHWKPTASISAGSDREGRMVGKLRCVSILPISRTSPRLGWPFESTGAGSNQRKDGSDEIGAAVTLRVGLFLMCAGREALAFLYCCLAPTVATAESLPAAALKFGKSALAGSLSLSSSEATPTARTTVAMAEAACAMVPELYLTQFTAPPTLSITELNQPIFDALLFLLLLGLGWVVKEGSVG